MYAERKGWSPVAIDVDVHDDLDHDGQDPVDHRSMRTTTTPPTTHRR